MEDWIVKNEGTAYCKTYFLKESLAIIFYWFWCSANLEITYANLSLKLALLLSMISVIILILCQRWNSWTAFLVEVSGHKLESSQSWVFVWFSTLIFLFYKMLVMNRLDFSCFAGLFVKIFFRNEYGYLLYPSVKGTVISMEQKTRVFC